MLTTRKWLSRLIALSLVLVIAGPEFGLSLELLAVVNLFGAELFLLSLFVGVRLLLMRWVVDGFIRSIERIDPFFFVPDLRQIATCPGVVAHALPGFVVAYVGWILVTPLATDV